MKIVNFNVSYENLISRIPGLFAYLDYDEDKDLIQNLHLSIDSLNGCYGHIVENIKLPVDFKTNDGIILRKNKVYSYKTIMTYYYQYRDKLDLVDEKDEFIGFIERGIGKLKTPQELLDKYSLIPEYIYLATSKRLYNEMIQLKKLCEFYEKNKTVNNNDDEVCCLIKKYHTMGGMDYILLLQSYFIKAQDISNEFFLYAKEAQQEKNHITINLDIDVTSSYHDLGLVTPIDFNETKKIPLIVSNEKGEKVEVDCIKITGMTDSKLYDFRKIESYRNSYGVFEIPSIENEDWLYFYRKNKIVNIRTLTDEFGNLLSLDGKTADDKSTDKLVAYGDFIYDIIPDKVKGIITFIYKVGVHLTADYDSFDIDDDGNKLHFWKNFRWDNDNKRGITYKENYMVHYNTDLYNLINDNFFIENNTEKIDFEKYINGEYDDFLKFNKFEFYKNTNDNITDFEIYRNDFSEFKESKLIKYDFYNHMTYNPNFESNVYIERGNTSVFQKHLAFGEVKTMEDMETYQNGGFFNMDL